MIHMHLSFSRYCQILQPISNDAVDLQTLFSPFGLEVEGPSSQSILYGHILDLLWERTENSDQVDVVDVAIAAYDLGYGAAGALLDRLPAMLIS